MTATEYNQAQQQYWSNLFFGPCGFVFIAFILIIILLCIYIWLGRKEKEELFEGVLNKTTAVITKYFADTEHYTNDNFVYQFIVDGEIVNGRYYVRGVNGCEIIRHRFKNGLVLFNSDLETFKKLYSIGTKIKIEYSPDNPSLASRPVFDSEMNLVIVKDDEE